MSDSAQELNEDGIPKEKIEVDAEGNPIVKVDAKEEDFNGLKKNYDELRSWTTRTAAENSKVKKELESLHQSIGSLTEALNRSNTKKVDPQTFLEDFNKRGPEVLDELFSTREKAIREAYDRKLAEQADQIRAVAINSEIATRKHDPKYPDWEKLEPTMNKIASDPNCPIDFSKPEVEIMDELYKLAKEDKMPGAMEQMKQDLKAQIRKELEEEARTASDGTGGKKGVITNKKIEEMSLDDLEKYIKQTQK
jgi:septal ring factor EnvC (AmiA/AmiB activator)